MDSVAFDHFVLRIVEAHDGPITVGELAGMVGTSARAVERALGRLAEAGSVRVRAGRHGEAEYFLPRRRAAKSARNGGASPGEASSPPAGVDVPAPESPATAVLLSLVVPGAGHVYNGRTGAGVAWMASTLAGYACCLLPGVLLHGLCLISAAQLRRMPA
jgi:hypothetical protein